ncbi:alpha/beta fold hydrolase [Sphingomonas sp. OK281]|uniref:alpha/beta fold hydrolase n=1 Tax=Sphingomonas sp. OK281 TaxID=1881067 RepID=UPI0008E2EF36|nr:alpha/beta fold hydrolase [Sphingomonas sp. OK281]SFO43230.1 Pimeloyl-ACP methyl ester carboxylesterase [Sphingomonas sp. OK281]
MPINPAGRTIPAATHHRGGVNAADIHYVTAGDAGTPVLLVHGFPESWWAFHGLIPLLARTHRVIAVDLRGFGDSSAAAPEDDSTTAAEDLHALIAHLGLGPVHLLVQDISGAAGLRLSLRHPDSLLSLTGVETGFAGFGLEIAADMSRGGAWYIGPLATPHVADTFFRGREAALIGQFLLPVAVADRESVSSDSVAEFARGYARQGGWSGAGMLYGSMVKESADLQALAAARATALPTLAVDRAGSAFTADALGAALGGTVRHAQIANVGHYIAQEAPAALAEALLPFFAAVDAHGHLHADAGD